MVQTPEQFGEHRHERCRFGMLTPAFRVDALTGRETPDLMPLCHWKPERAPPAMMRAWGGAIEFARDCAFCPVFEEVA